MLLTIVTLLFVSGLGALIFIYSGFYDIAASRPHTKLVEKMLLMTKRQAVKFHARDVKVPNLDNEEFVKKGFVLYRRNCVTCHGAPGESRSRIGIGVNPNPPPLEKAVEEWSEAEVAWIIKHGLKMAGMPAFKFGHTEEDIWAMTAFVKRINTLSPQEYRQMLAATEEKIPKEKVCWLPKKDSSDEWVKWEDSQEGKELIEYHGCAACHVIPGIKEPRGNVGPPLNNWKERHYISGTMVNTPDNFVKWILDPPHFDANTAMPDLELTEEEAKKIANYLYTLY
ncbi:MAG: c-type cytochrome [Candidatus Omnitrophica bacterium]|nr:c-type cytochrome [Candidatus Omnitrophota bacterium]